MSTCPELLAPAGHPAALEAALAGGADAVYLGGPAFGARAGACFSEAALREAVRLAHFWGKRVYVTVNTLVKPWEIDALRGALRLLADVGADAVLVQDLGALRLARREFPGLVLHASTQMSVHSASGARFLREEGVRRVVLARECGPDVMRQVAAQLETEVFVHGALCASVSGQCLMSAMAGGRSGNRGRCAQPCRKTYRYEGETACVLSPRDICLRDRLDTLAAAGVSSLKIEGRLKRPEYVYAVVSAYRAALDALAQGRFARADEAERERLAQAFNRGAFSEGYAGDARDAALVNPRFAGGAGVTMGEIVRAQPRANAVLLTARLTRALHDGDALRVGADEMVYQGDETQPGCEAVLRAHQSAAPGTLLQRLTDASVTGDIQTALARMRVPFSARLTLSPGEESTLEVWDGAHRAFARGEHAQYAQSRPTDEEAARRAVAKTGGTPFELHDFSLSGAPAFLPAAAMNALRRDALDALAEARSARTVPPPAPAVPPPRCAPACEQARPLLIVRAFDASCAHQLLDAGADMFVWEPLDYTPDAFARGLACLPDGALVKLPRQATDSLLDLLRGHIARCADRLGGVVLSNIGQMGVSWPLPFFAGEGIPAMNPEAIDFLLAHGARGVALHEEASRKCMAALSPHGALAAAVYGRAPLMLLNHCPARVRAGLRGPRAACTLQNTPACAHGKPLTDDMGHVFPLSRARTPEGCLVRVLSALPLDLSAFAAPLRALNVSWLVRLTDEPEDARARVVAHFKRLMAGEEDEVLPWPGTAGLFRREIE